MRLTTQVKIILAMALMAIGSVGLAGDFSAVEARIKAAMAAQDRPEGDKARDANRKPLETLKFFGLKDDMTIVELIPGGGWYTRILAPAVAESGKYYAAYGTGRVEDLLKQDGFKHGKILAVDSKVYRPEGERFYVLENPDLGVKNVDMVLTFRNYHNFGEAGRRAMNEAAYKALKKGGIYAVVDHTRRHMEPDTDENRRRLDPVLAIKEIQDAGFELVGFSTLHHRPVDKLDLEVGHESVTGQTDRWTLKFRKK